MFELRRILIPEQDTPASRAWSQLIPPVMSAGQEKRLTSDPLQSTRDMATLPVPFPKNADLYAVPVTFLQRSFLNKVYLKCMLEQKYEDIIIDLFLSSTLIFHFIIAISIYPSIGKSVSIRHTVVASRSSQPSSHTVLH